MGAVGAGISIGSLVKIVGTSTCDIMIHPHQEKLNDIPGVYGIVDGSGQRGERFPGATDDLPEQQTVREYRQMMPVLFECCDWEHHRNVLRKSGDRRPGEVNQVHEMAR